jgi:hypothetical protein
MKMKNGKPMGKVAEPRSKVAFSIQGKDLQLENISRTLGLEATHTHKASDFTSERQEKMYEHDMWSLESR